MLKIKGKGIDTAIKIYSYTRDSSNFPRCRLVSNIFSAYRNEVRYIKAKIIERIESYQCDRSEPGDKGFILTGTNVPTRISAPVASRDFSIAQPYTETTLLAPCEIFIQAYIMIIREKLKKWFVVPTITSNQ